MELGVLGGGSLLSWAQLSSIYEHLNYQRKIIGFDTFRGFAKLTSQDGKKMKKKDLAVPKDHFEYLCNLISRRLINLHTV